MTVFCSAQEKDLVLAGTGGHLTMLSSPTGLGKGAAAEHAAAWQKIAVTKAVRINDTLQRDFDAPELAAQFPGQPVCVEFALGIKDAEDVGQLLDNVVKAEGVGLLVDAQEISERSGLKLTRPPASAPATLPEDLSRPSSSMADPIANLAAKLDRRVDKKAILTAMKSQL